MNLYLYLLLYLYLCLFWQTAFVPKPVDGEGGSIERGDLEAALCKSCFDSLCPVPFCFSLQHYAAAAVTKVLIVFNSILSVANNSMVFNQFNFPSLLFLTPDVNFWVCE